MKKGILSIFLVSFIFNFANAEDIKQTKELSSKEDDLSKKLLELQEKMKKAQDRVKKIDEEETNSKRR